LSGTNQKIRSKKNVYGGVSSLKVKLDYNLYVFSK